MSTLDNLLLWTQCEIVVAGKMPSVIGNDGVVTGTDTIVAGYFNNGFAYNRGAVKFENIAATKFTVEFWMKLSYDFDQEDANHIVFNPPTGAGFNFVLKIFSRAETVQEQQIAIEILSTVSGGIISTFGADVDFSAGEWHHWAIAVDNSATKKIRLFFDGVEKTADFILGSAAISMFSIHIAADAHTMTDVVIDNIKIWNYVKTDFSDRFAEYPGDNITVNDIYNNIYDWLNLVINTEQGNSYPIIQARQDAPAPSREGLYLVVGDNPRMNKLGRQSNIGADSNNGLTLLIDDYELTWELWEVNGTGEQLRRAIDSIERQDIKDIFRGYNFSIVRVGEIQYLPRIAENKWAKECMVELTLHVRFQTVSIPGYIENVAYSGTVPAAGRSGEHIIEE